MKGSAPGNRKGALTGLAVMKIRPDPEKRLEVPDGLVAGLYLTVHPSGRKSWAVRYRIYGRSRRMVLGPLGASDAKAAGAELTRVRTEAAAILEAARGGDDPAGAKQAEKRKTRDAEIDAAGRFDLVARSFLTRYAKPKNRSWKETARLLGLVPNRAAPDRAEDPKTFEAVRGGIADRWGHRPIRSITRPEILAELDAIVDRGAPVAANRTLAALRRLFGWAVERGFMGESPCTGLKAPSAEKSRDRVLTDAELKYAWEGAETLGYPFGPFFRLLMLTGQRRDEVAAMRWREIDLEAGLWTLPRDRVKNDKAHEVPLSAPAIEILRGIPRIGSGGWVFTGSGKAPVSGFSRAKRNLDAAMLGAMQEAGEIEPEGELEGWRIHDLRRTVASGLARLGIALPVIERVLNHTSGSFGGVVGVYQRHDFADEKRTALEAWGSFVASLMEGQRKNVVPLREAK